MDDAAPRPLIPQVGEGKRGENGYLGYLLRQAAGAYRHRMERVLADLRVTPPQFSVLTMLAAYPGISNAIWRGWLSSPRKRSAPLSPTWNAPGPSCASRIITMAVSSGLTSARQASRYWRPAVSGCRVLSKSWPMGFPEKRNRHFENGWFASPRQREIFCV